MQRHSRRLSRGSALLSALFVMTLMAIAATAMLNRVRLEVLRTGLVLQTDRWYLASQVVQFWAMSVLKQPQPALQVANPQGLVLTLPSPLRRLYPGVRVQGAIYDLQARFNLNNLKSPQQQSILQELMLTLMPTLDKHFLQTVSLAAADWITSDVSPGQDHWSQYYGSMRPPYQAAHQPFVSTSEFHLVAGVTSEMYQRLFPYITALPGIALLNVNTAPAPLLRAVNPTLTDSQLNEILNERQQHAIRTAEEFSLFAQTYGFNQSLVGYESQYFLSEAIVQTNRPFVVYSLLKRVAVPPNQWNVYVVRESMGVL